MGTPRAGHAQPFLLCRHGAVLPEEVLGFIVSHGGGVPLDLEQMTTAFARPLGADSPAR